MGAIVERGEQFEARIRRNPEDLDAWLVYADWLSDRGDERGKHIAVEISLARDTLTATERAQLRHRHGVTKHRRSQLAEIGGVI